MLSDTRETLEEQLVFWEQVETSREEVASWLRSNNANLDQLHQNFSDTMAVENALQKYKVGIVTVYTPDQTLIFFLHILDMVFVMYMYLNLCHLKYI